MKYHMWDIWWDGRQKGFDCRLSFDNREREEISQTPMAVGGFMQCIYRFPETVTPDEAFETLRTWMLDNLVTRPAEIEDWVQRIKAVKPEYGYVIDERGYYYGPFVGAKLYSLNIT